MSLTVFAPALYLLFGYCLGKTRFEIKGLAAALLTKILIPLVIVYNVATQQTGLAVVVLGTIMMMATMLMLGRLFTRDPIRNLCFAYLNIGWFGLPIATALWGDGGAMVFIAAYLGNTIFGNAIGSQMLDRRKLAAGRSWKTLTSPPVLAIVLGLALMPYGHWTAQHFRPAYAILKFMLGFTGMTVLGLWLATCTISLKDIAKEFRPYVYKTVSYLLLLSLFIQAGLFFEIPLITNNIAALYLICLLPPAANIVVLETHFMQTGRSAKMIVSGTCISIITISIYALCVKTLYPA